MGGQVPGRWERVCDFYPCDKDCVRLIAFHVLSTMNSNSATYSLATPSVF